VAQLTPLLLPPLLPALLPHLLAPLLPALSPTTRGSAQPPNHLNSRLRQLLPHPFPQANELGWDVCSLALLLSAGKECEGKAAAAALGTLRAALRRRLLQLLGKLDVVLNTPKQLERFCGLPLTVLEVRAVGFACRLDGLPTAQGLSALPCVLVCVTWTVDPSKLSCFSAGTALIK